MTLMGRMLPAALVVVLAGGLAVGIGAMTGALDSTAAEGRPSAGATPSPTGNAGLRSGSATVPRTAQPSSGPSEPARRPAREDGAPVPGTDPQPSSEQVTSEPTRPAASSRRVPSQTPQAGSTEAPAGTRAATSSESGSTSSQTSTKPKPKALTTAAIVNHGGGRCIDVTGRGRTGVQLAIWDCEPVEPWRTWTFYSDGTIRSQGHCMTAVGSGNGAPIQVRTCTGGASQRFTLNASHDLVNIAADRCVDVTDGRVHENTAPLQLWACQGADNQKWSLY